MKLYELLSNLDTKVPIRVIEVSPPEHPDETQHTEIIFDSEKSYRYCNISNILSFMLLEEFIIDRITLCDSDYLFRLSITVIRL